MAREFGEAGSCGVLEMLQRPASEGEPYKERTNVVATSETGGGLVRLRA